MAPISPYSTALVLGRPKPDYIKNTTDQDRVASYWTYWDIYRNVAEAFAAVLRDDEGNEVSRRYIPAARTIIEATNRYLAKDPTITPNPVITAPDGATVNADPNLLASIMKLWSDFAAREEFFTKFLSLKRWMLIRGDGALHLTADDTKPQGTRLRLTEVDPSNVFVIANPIDPTRVVGVYVVNIVDSDEGDAIAMRQAYIKTEQNTIFTQLTFWEKDGWDDRPPMGQDDLKAVAPPAAYRESAATLLTGFELPAPIDSIPVYIYKNNREGDAAWGISEIQGIETLLAGINQTATDEDVTMALTGIGVYVTTSGRPKNPDGSEGDWVIAPASVIELESEGDSFTRVAGVDDVKPMLDHKAMLEAAAQQTTGTPDVAVGRVDVSVAESGIALSIQMSPILSKNAEKELELKGKTDQFLFDWLKFAQAYEGLQSQGVTLGITFGDPLPVDRAATLDEIIQMVTNKIISIEFAQRLIRERLGYDIPTDMVASVVAEQGQLSDATGARLDAEAGLA